jgi:hypothetical protein
MISIDNNKTKWKETSVKKKFPWTNTLDKNGVNITYAILSIHQNFLIDKNVIIVGKNLRGQELNKKLKELLRKE